MNPLLIFALWLIAPTVGTILIAIVLSLVGMKVPKARSNLSWFEKRDW